MKNLSQYKHLFLLTVSFLITALDSIPRIVIYMSGEVFRPKAFGYEPHPAFTLYYLLADTLISSLIFAYINYSWRDKILFKRLDNRRKMLAVILMNLLLIVAFTVSKIFVYNAIYATSVTPRLYLLFILKTIFLCSVGLLTSYILFLIVKTKIFEIENLKLRRENMEAQLVSLKDQINPHFLFNTLNSLSSVIRLGEKQESLMFVDKMSEVYRYILESNDYKLIELQKEIEFLDAYIFMLGKRFGQKLKIDIKFDEGCTNCLLPPLALQILVENAIKHNKITEPAPLQISIFNKDDYLIVENNLMKKKSEGGYGIGLANLRNRYKLLVEKDIEISQSTDSFIVKLPIIRK